MGNLNNKSNLNDDVEEISKLNSITNSEIFKKTLGIRMHFIIDEDPDLFSQIFNQPSEIFVEIHKIKINSTEDIYYIDPLIEIYFKDSDKLQKYLNKNQFYKFYNTLLDCLPVFYENSLQKIKDSIQPLQTNEEELCCICDDKKSDVMLECCHFFCEDCIKTWLFKKVNSCPLCRVKINLSDPISGEKEDKNYWSVIEREHVDFNEYIEELRERLRLVIIATLS